MKKKIIITFISICCLVTIGKSFAESVFIEANKQVHDGSTNITSFEGNVKVNFENIEVKSPKAQIQLNKENKPADAVFLEGAHAVKDNGESQNDVKAEIIKLSLLNNIMQAEGNAVTSFKDSEKPMVTIKADFQEFDNNTNLMVANGNVIINYKDLETYSKQAKIVVGNNGDLDEVNLIGNAKIIQEGSVVKANKFLFNPVNNDLVAIGNAFTQSNLEDSSTVKIWSNYQQYNRNTNTLMASGRVKIHYKNYVATGPKATFLPSEETKKPNKIIFYGRSKIQEGQRLVEADRIEITIDPKNFLAEGNVKTKFTQVKGLNDSFKKK